MTDTTGAPEPTEPIPPTLDHHTGSQPRAYSQLPHTRTYTEPDLPAAAPYPHTPEPIRYFHPEPSYPAPQAVSADSEHSHQKRPPHPAPRKSFDPGVDLVRYIGSAVITAGIAAAGAYLGMRVLNLVMGWVPASYWITRGLVAPHYDPTVAAWLAAASAIIAAGVMWLLLQITASTAMFAAAITALVAAIGAVVILGTGTWQLTLGPALLFAVMTAAIGVMTAAYTRFSTTRPERY